MPQICLFSLLRPGASTSLLDDRQCRFRRLRSAARQFFLTITGSPPTGRNNSPGLIGSAALLRPFQKPCTLVGLPLGRLHSEDRRSRLQSPLTCLLAVSQTPPASVRPWQLRFLAPCPSILREPGLR